MTNRERAEGLVKKIAENYEAFVPADMSPFREKEYDAFQADAIEQALNEAEARGRVAGLEEAANLAWKIAAETPPDRIGSCLIGDQIEALSSAALPVSERKDRE